ncbi:hypothetical protein M3212_00395 [Alkalihalobacillus oceani]|uniref:hypothetical protein n=1 Tax=Halalkalibacter oceani TaxID=1653776 RepID=UPI00203BEDE3|nr:hypothetical protein [Halalkalibacter oceani]MCM3759235.1 hypothetical protein [Halalkalibacter oceani]
MKLVAVNEYTVHRQHETSSDRQLITIRSMKPKKEFEEEYLAGIPSDQRHEIHITKSQMNLFCVYAVICTEALEKKREVFRQKAVRDQLSIREASFYTIEEVINHQHSTSDLIYVFGFGLLTRENLDAFKMKYNRILANFLNPHSELV